MESAETLCNYFHESIFIKEASRKDQVTPCAPPKPPSSGLCTGE